MFMLCVFVMFLKWKMAGREYVRGLRVKGTKVYNPSESRPRDTCGKA